MKFMEKIGLLILALLLVSCGPTEEAIAQAIAETEAAKPTETKIPTETLAPTDTPIPTPTQIPLKDIDIGQFVEGKYDLPPGYSLSQIRDSFPLIYEDCPTEEAFYWQDLEYQDEIGGKVMVFIFDTVEKADNCYEIIYDGLGDDISTGDLGTRSVGWKIDMSGYVIAKYAGYVTQMENFLVIVEFKHITDINAARTFSSNIIERMIPVILP